MTSDTSEQPPPRASEKHLLELVKSVSIQGNVLTQTQGRGHLALELAQADEVQVDCWFIDQYQANLARQLCNDGANIICQPDPPSMAYDWAFLPLGRNGETEFVRETLQCFFDRLSTNGQMWVAVDNPQDRWVRQQLDRFDLQIQTVREPTSIAYCCRKRGPLKKRKEYGCEFMYRDRGRLLKAYSRPGVFSHRRIDPGARHLIDAMQLGAGDRILDMGCGAGTVSLAAAAISSANQVHAIDCNARAIECTERGKTLNELTNVTTQLTAGGELDEPNTFDVFLGNPPYYANLSIAGLFLDTAQRALRIGGRAYFVSKHAEWYSEALPEFFTDIEIWPVKGYVIASGIRI